MFILDLDDLTRLFHRFKEDEEDDDKPGAGSDPPYRN